ncbi:hypothetical protein [Xenorhabdus mauleonii]
MSQYIVTYNGLGSDNSVLVSSQISFDFDWSDNAVNDFLNLVIDTASSNANQLNNSVARISIVRIYNLP